MADEPRRPWPGIENLPPEVKHMAEASHRALDTPEGEAILQQMSKGELDIAEGLAKLLVISGEYEERSRGDRPDGVYDADLRMGKPRRRPFRKTKRRKA